MKVFITGGSGFVGSAVVQELISAGHKVTGLARSDGSASKLVAAGASVVRGEITDYEIIADSAKAADAVVHLAFNHDFSRFAENCAEDAKLIATVADALAGTQRPFLVTSGILVADLSTGIIDESTPTGKIPRGASENAVSDAVAKGVRATAIRLPPSVHGTGDH
ncbi:hypothetical protein HK100_010018, partial [Physocladia obscura]